MRKHELVEFLFLNPGGLITLLNNFALETSIVFLPLFAEELGASKFQIGLLGSAYGITYAVSSLVFSRQADRGSSVRLVRFSLGFGILVFASQSFAGNPFYLMLARAAIGFCLGISAAALMAYNYTSGRSTGQFASLGCLGWLLGDTAAMFCHSYHALFLSGAAGCGLAFIISLSLKNQKIQPILKPDTMKIIRRNVHIYLPFLLRQIGAYMVWAILPLYLASLGASKTWIAALAIINAAAQFLIMIFAENIKASRLFPLGLLLSALVFLGYAQAHNYLHVIPVQLLLSVAWSFLYVGALILLLKNNVEGATATGVLFSTISVSASIGPTLGGLVAQFWGYQSLMHVAIGLCLTGFIVNIISTR